VKLIDDNFINIYRYEYNTPYINKNDNRMTPNTFEGIRLLEPMEVKTTLWDSGTAAVTSRRSRSVIQIGSDGCRKTLGQIRRKGLCRGRQCSYKGLSFGAIDYFSEDNHQYLLHGRFLQVSRDGPPWPFLRSPVHDQRSTGEELLTGDSFQTNR